jgi:hypothetical protein
MLVFYVLRITANLFYEELENERKAQNIINLGTTWSLYICSYVL